MPTFDYARSARTANRLIGKFGMNCVLRRTDPDADWESEAYLPLMDIVGVDTRPRVKDADGTLATHTTRVLVVRVAEGVVPTKADMIAIGESAASADEDTVYLGISDVAVIAPGGPHVVYKLTLEG